MSDEDFWIHWIADTPEEDEEYSGCGWLVLIGLIMGAVVIWALI